MNEVEQRDTGRTLHQQHGIASFAEAHRTFSRMDHMLRHKINRTKVKKTITISSTAFLITVAYKLKSIAGRIAKVSQICGN